MTVKLVTSKVEMGICRLTLNTPKNRNALSLEMMGQLTSALSECESDDSVRVIILQSTGSVFCAGHDLKELTAARSQKDSGQQFYKKVMNQCSSLMQQIVNHPKPIIAKISGVATAAGCQLVASCDLAIAGSSAKFATPGVLIGLFCSTPMVALSRNVSRKHAMEMLLTGDMIDAEQAEKIGLVNKVSSDDELDLTTNRMAEKIASKSQMTLKIGKKAFYQQIEMPLDKAYQYAANVMVENMLKRDAQEGINAFIEKRKPEWNDK